MSWIEGLAVPCKAIPTCLAACCTLQHPSVQALLPLFWGGEASVQGAVTDAELKVAHVMGGYRNFELSNATSHICSLRRGSLHVHHVSDGGWLVSKLLGITAEAVGARIINCGPNAIASRLYRRRATRLQAMWTIFTIAQMLQEIS